MEQRVADIAVLPCTDTPWRQSALGRMTGAGAILPAIDKLASTLIGDNPALMQMLRCATCSLQNAYRG